MPGRFFQETEIQVVACHAFRDAVAKVVAGPNRAGAIGQDQVRLVAEQIAVGLVFVGHHYDFGVGRHDKSPFSGQGILPEERDRLVHGQGVDFDAQDGRDGSMFGSSIGCVGISHGNTTPF